MNLFAAFAAAAEPRRHRPAIFWGDEQITFGTVLDQSAAVAEALRTTFGVQAGDRVGLWLKNCPEFVPALFGALGAGAVVVPINNFLKPGEVSFILADAGIDVLITDASMAEFLARLSAVRPQLKVLPVETFAEMTAGTQGSASLRTPGSESDLAVLLYTSGTTGHPKGAMLTHGNLLHNVHSCQQVLGATDVERLGVVLPMFHSFMLTVGVLLPMLLGAALVLVRSLHPAKNVIHELLAHRATILPAVPQLFRALASAHVPPEFPIRLCISGGAPLPVELLREFNQKMPCPLIEGYGLSEASPVCSLNPPHGMRKAGSIGLPIPGVEMSIQDGAGRLLGVGETGEVCVRGGNVMSGYWNQPAESAAVLRGGWLLTGDIGHRDTDGYFYITDRKKDMLLVNGINVYPREIEEVIYQFPGVKEVAVIGVPDARKGEQPLAFVAVHEGATVDASALRQFLRERLADYKVPRHISLLGALPRNATGKILKTQLRQTARQSAESEPA